jgi:hypothetical protein
MATETQDVYNRSWQVARRWTLLGRWVPVKPTLPLVLHSLWQCGTALWGLSCYYERPSVLTFLPSRCCSCVKGVLNSGIDGDDREVYIEGGDRLGELGADTNEYHLSTDQAHAHSGAH